MAPDNEVILASAEVTPDRRVEMMVVQLHGLLRPGPRFIFHGISQFDRLGSDGRPTLWAGLGDLWWKGSVHGDLPFTGPVASG